MLNIEFRMKKCLAIEYFHPYPQHFVGMINKILSQNSSKCAQRGQPEKGKRENIAHTPSTKRYDFVSK